MDPYAGKRPSEYELPDFDAKLDLPDQLGQTTMGQEILYEFHKNDKERQDRGYSSPLREISIPHCSLGAKLIAGVEETHKRRMDDLASMGSGAPGPGPWDHPSVRPIARRHGPASQVSRLGAHHAENSGGVANPGASSRPGEYDKMAGAGGPGSVIDRCAAQMVSSLFPYVEFCHEASTEPC